MRRFLFLIALYMIGLGSSAQAIYVGNVSNSDDLASIPYDGYKGVCSAVSASNIQRYAGSQVVGLRIALGSTSLTDFQAFLSADPDPAHPQNNLASATLTSFEQGWNEVTFAQPYTLTGQEAELYIGYYFSCASTDERPVLLGTSKSTYGLLIYESAQQGTGWYDYSATGDLAIQLILRGGSVPDYDIALSDLTTDSRYYPTDADKMRMVVSLINKGAKAIPSLTLNLAFDGNTALGGDLQVDEEVSGNMTLPLELPIADYQLAAGKHTLTLSLKQLGEGLQVSDGTTDDDAVTTTFYVYEQSVPRSHALLEVFASADSYYDSRFTEPLEAFLSEHHEVIPVFIHGYFGESTTDPLALSNADRLANAAGLRSVPSFGINRFAFTGSQDYLYAYTAQPTADDFAELKTYIDEAQPAFAAISLEGTYNERSRLLTLNVSGTRTADFQNIFGDGALTVYLTEDDVDGHQHVLRKIMTAPLGTAITWDGLNFTKTQRLTFEQEWNPAKMHAVAFIHKATTADTPRDEMEVTAATVLDIVALTADGIAALPHDGQSHPSPIYDLTGRSLSTTPSHPGIYVREGKKVVVK